MLEETTRFERDEWRIDVSLLEYNLSLTHEDRLFQHQQALNLFLEIQKAGRNYYAGLEQATQFATDE